MIGVGISLAIVLVGVAIGGGRIHFDSTITQPDPEYVETPIEVIAQKGRETILRFYYLAFVPVLIVGAIAFLASTIVSRDRLPSIFAMCWLRQPGPSFSCALRCWFYR